MKALALFSGGLDSTVAVKLILEQGIEVVALNFKTAFCLCDKGRGCGSVVKNMADQLGVELRMVYLGQEYLDLVKSPRYGYGRNLNPCIDCRIHKFKKAKDVMKEVGASFIFTGEVLGQRPMSQHRQALITIDKRSGLEGMVLRPLSAKLFSPTLAEKEGWVDREALLEISGRTRKPQMQLADAYDIKNYPCSAGGCLLTDPTFTKRMKDFMRYKDVTVKDIEFLKIGRYFRIKPQFSLTVGRNELENNRLLGICEEEDFVFEPLDQPGPTAIGRGELDSQTKDICSRIIARYTIKDQGGQIKVKVKRNRVDSQELVIAGAMAEDELERLRIS